jgi:hypothetical protein
MGQVAFRFSSYGSNLKCAAITGAIPAPRAFKESASMDPTTVRIVAGVIFVVLVFIIIARRKSMAAKRKRVP